MRLLGFVGCLCVIAAVGCTDTERPNTPSSTSVLSAAEFVPADKRFRLETPIWESTDPRIGTPSDLVLHGDYLWVADRKGDPFLHALDARTGQVVFSRVRRGRGPGELESAAAVGPWDSSGAIWVHDLNQRRLVVVPVDSTQPSLNFPTESSDGGRRILRLAGRHNGFLALTLGSDVALSPVTRSETTNLRTLVPSDSVDPLVLDGSDISGGALRSALMQGALCVGATGNVAYALFGEAQVFRGSVTSRDFTSLPLPFSSQPEYTVDSTGSSRWTQQRRYYVDCAWTGEYLFALFGGYASNARPDSLEIAREEIHVHAVDGSLVAVGTAPHRSDAISVSEDGNTVYLSASDEAIVRAYALPRWQK